MVQKVVSSSSESNQYSVIDGQKKAIELRRSVNSMYFDLGLTKDEISVILGVSKGFVVSWTQHSQQDPKQDLRGWPKGKHRSYDPVIVERVRRLHKQLVEDPREAFTGATAIELAWSRSAGPRHQGHQEAFQVLRRYHKRACRARHRASRD